MEKIEAEAAERAEAARLEQAQTLARIEAEAKEKFRAAASKDEETQGRLKEKRNDNQDALRQQMFEKRELKQAQHAEVQEQRRVHDAYAKSFAEEERMQAMCKREQHEQHRGELNRQIA